MTEQKGMSTRKKRGRASQLPVPSGTNKSKCEQCKKTSKQWVECEKCEKWWCYVCSQWNFMSLLASVITFTGSATPAMWALMNYGIRKKYPNKCLNPSSKVLTVKSQMCLKL